MTRRVMSQPEIFRIGNLIKENIKELPVVEGAPKLCQYNDGWDDDRIAAAIAPDLTATHSKNLRKNLFGELFTPEENSAMGALIERLDAAEKKLADALTFVHSVIESHNKLCTAISLAKGGSLDARHLILSPSKKNGANDPTHSADYNGTGRAGMSPATAEQPLRSK